MQDQNIPKSESLQEFPQRPVTFMFQPTHYEIVPPERLTEWEDMLRKQVGLNPHSMRSGGTETWSISYGDWGWDDCDVL